MAFGGLFDAVEDGMNNAKKQVKKVKPKQVKAKKPSIRIGGRVVPYNPSKMNTKTKRVPVYSTPPTSGSGGGASYSSPGRITGGGGGGGGLGRSGGTGNADRFARTSAAAMSAPSMPSESEWLAGDSTYQDQTSEYTRALQEYIARISEREGEIKEDAKLALGANARNRTSGMNNNAEDFASRGMINSGLFADSSEKLSDRYNESQGAIETNQSRGLGAIADERSSYEQENELAKNNARRSALQRMAAQFGTF